MARAHTKANSGSTEAGEKGAGEGGDGGGAAAATGSSRRTSSGGVGAGMGADASGWLGKVWNSVVPQESDFPIDGV